MLFLVIKILIVIPHKEELKKRNYKKTPITKEQKKIYNKRYYEKKKRKKTKVNQSKIKIETIIIIIII